ncbi:MAG: PD-(D/E)XK nuclease family protein [Synergistaceae bacterium]|nr:PD-(D/E)XK nuclease family protein [Synergistaceae bacterium]
MFEFWTRVSDLAICQRCPALFGYKIHMGKKDVWKIGIKGRGQAYGSMFHKNIAQVFFEAASDSRNALHPELTRAVSQGEAALEEFVREKIFLPFLAGHSEEYTSGQLMAAANGVTVWVKAMADFFAEIPSLKNNPERSMSTIFLEPERKLQASYDFPGEGRLKITGCYDALVFNPDRAEARLFEFKGYAKSDLAVPLSQSLMYAWLIEKFSGIVPSVEVIYLDEENRKPDIFDSENVRQMIIAGLPGLFRSAFNTKTLRRLPEIVKDEKLCSVCPFNGKCDYDRATGFGKRRGASMINVLVFFMMAMMVSAQVFFSTSTSLETTGVQADAMNRRFIYEKYLNEAIQTVRTTSDALLRRGSAYSEAAYAANLQDASGDVTSSFFEQRKTDREKTGNTVRYEIFDLNYTLVQGNPPSGRDLTDMWRGHIGGTYFDELHKMIFPPMSEDHYLIRVYENEAADPSKRRTQRLMYQVVVKKNGENTPAIKSFQEVWY